MDDRGDVLDHGRSFLRIMRSTERTPEKEALYRAAVGSRGVGGVARKRTLAVVSHEPKQRSHSLRGDP